MTSTTRRSARAGRSRGLARAVARVLAIAVAVTVLQVVRVASPSFACACGAMEPPTDSASQFQVSDETALVKYHDGVEDIYLSFDVRSTSRDAALILPLPTKATFDLGPKTLFPDLLELTRPPLPRADGSTGDGAAAGAAPQAAPPVTNLGTTDLGPMTVTQLASKDSGALTAYLKANGFRARDAVVRRTQPYLDEGWVIAVVRLKAGAPMSGAMRPVHARFSTPRMVYPMRLQAAATRTESLRVYTLTEQKVDAILPGSAVDTVYAGPVTQTDTARYSSLASLTAERPGAGSGAGTSNGASVPGPRRSIAGLTPVATTGWYLTRSDVRVDPVTVVADMSFGPARDSSDVGGAVGAYGSSTHGSSTRGSSSDVYAHDRVDGGRAGTAWLPLVVAVLLVALAVGAAVAVQRRDARSGAR